ncbi:hypothetical protein Gohar_026734, partial [Gossypium harknessii]|nr:hypothetical protein [Gossypium harknessii]
TALEVFSVAHNNLSGPLPDRKNQFGTFDESNYEGNPLLCGPPLNKSCNGGDSPTAPNATSSEEEHGHIDMVDFYISFATSYAIIFLTTILSSSVALLQEKHLALCFFNGSRFQAQ